MVTTLGIPQLGYSPASFTENLLTGGSATQLLTLFALGVLLFDLQIRGSVLGVIAVSGALSLSLLSFGVAITAISRTSQQLNAFGNIGGMIFATVGGALTPLSVLPGWVQDIAPLTPTYWAMEAYRDIILEGQGLGAAVLPTFVLLLFAAGFGLIAIRRFRFEDSKIYWG